MQALHGTSTGSKGGCPEAVGWEVLDAAPPLMWFIRRAMRAHRRGLSMPQFRALVMIANQPSVCLSEVAENLALSLPTASRIVSGLVTQGLLTRKDCADDRRQVSIVITTKGQAVLDASYAATQKELSTALSGFTPAQRTAVIEGMRLLKGVFGPLGLPPVKKSA
jgi:DNA-binding MarR family transcriptional regulator